MTLQVTEPPTEPEPLSFDTSKYPELRPTRPTTDKKSVTCPKCKKEGYRYFFHNKKENKDFMKHIHYDEPPNGVVTVHGKPDRFQYRTCISMVYNTFEEMIDSPAIRQLQTEKTIPKRKKKGSIGVECPRCGKLGTLGQPNKDGRIRVHHSVEKDIPKKQCFLITPEQMEVATNVRVSPQIKPEPKPKVREKREKQTGATENDKIKFLQTFEINKMLAEEEQRHYEAITEILKQMPKRGRGRPQKIGRGTETRF